MEPKLGAQPFQEFDAAAAETFERTLEKNYTCVTWPKLCAVKEPSWEEEKVQTPWRFFVNKNGKKPTKQTGELVRIYMDSRKDSFIFSSKVHEDCVIYFLIFWRKNPLKTHHVYNGFSMDPGPTELGPTLGPTIFTQILSLIH